MAGTAGGKRTGAGRRRGTPGLKTKQCDELAEKLGINPFEVLLLMSGNRWKDLGYLTATKTMRTGNGTPYEVDQIEVPDRIAAAHHACKYLFPQRKAVEFEGTAVDTLTAIFKKIADGK